MACICACSRGSRLKRFSASSERGRSEESLRFATRLSLLNGLHRVQSSRIRLHIPASHTVIIAHSESKRPTTWTPIAMSKSKHFCQSMHFCARGPPRSQLHQFLSCRHESAFTEQYGVPTIFSRRSSRQLCRAALQYWGKPIAQGVYYSCLCGPQLFHGTSARQEGARASESSHC